MASYNAILTLSRQHSGAALADQVHAGDLDAYAVVTGVDHRGRAQIIITIEAANLTQANATARAVLAEFRDGVRLDVMTTAEYDRGDEPIPELLSLTEAAERLGVSRQAIQSRIHYGSLPARKVGHIWAIPAAATTK
ncbi:MAG: helix-turn-helix domain-containing protein [Arachnia sp.]